VEAITGVPLLSLNDALCDMCHCFVLEKEGADEETDSLPSQDQVSGLSTLFFRIFAEH